MSLTALSIYLARKFNFHEGWKEVQRERARRDYKRFKSQQNLDFQELYNTALDRRASDLSTILEPGYANEILRLLEEDQEIGPLTEYRDRYLEEKS